LAQVYFHERNRFLEVHPLPLGVFASTQVHASNIRKSVEQAQACRDIWVWQGFYSLLETAKLHDVDPARYLREAALAAERGETLPACQLALS
jgi:hypothetical protein